MSLRLCLVWRMEKSEECLRYKRELKKLLIGKEYFNHKSLEVVVTCYPYLKNLPKEDIIKVEFDQAKRWSPFQASKHPFVTGEPFTRPYRPPPETLHLVLVLYVLLVAEYTSICCSYLRACVNSTMWLRLD
ncbi:hypothetical protein PVK06_020492 [Gossypium arboreum]|uniref:Uncharacterized protein n=1 Tax=Gossypium arboreum TaxID=29729 RepID=A0ABR0PMI4_GOSAR|nr:hypothetical protein PVK06_020492 [Gossypium arboreum]